MSEERERKDLMDTLKVLLLTTEELKIALPPLIQSQKDTFKTLKLHEEAISSLMSMLIGSQGSHQKTLEKLDLLETQVSQLAKNLPESYENVIKGLEKRLKRLEFRDVSKILRKIVKQKLLTEDDLKIIEDALLLYPDDCDLLSIKGEVLNNLGRKQEALGFLEETISKYPNGARLWYVKGLLIENPSEQLQCFDKSLELLKDGPSISQHVVLHAKAGVLVSAERFEEALEVATRSVESAPSCDSAWRLKAKILRKLGRIAEALGCAEKAIELSMDDKENCARAWFEKAMDLSALGPIYVDQAIACYDKVIELWPIAEAYFNKGKVLTRIGKDEQAIQIIDKGLKIDSKNACAWCDRGSTLNRLGQNEEALHSLEKALELGPRKGCNQVLWNMAIVLYYAGRYEEGAKFARKIVDAEPENGEFWDTLACNLQRLGRDDEALKAFEKALSLRKSDEEISWDDLSELYERLGKKEEAKKARQKHKINKKDQ